MSVLDRLEALLAQERLPLDIERQRVFLTAAVNALPALIACARALKRIRQWDMIVGYIGIDGEQHESTADAPYWRAELDRALARLAEGEPQP